MVGPLVRLHLHHLERSPHLAVGTCHRHLLEWEHLHHLVDNGVEMAVAAVMGCHLRDMVYHRPHLVLVLRLRDLLERMDQAINGRPGLHHLAKALLEVRVLCHHLLGHLLHHRQAHHLVCRLLGRLRQVGSRHLQLPIVDQAFCPT